MMSSVRSRFRVNLRQFLFEFLALSLLVFVSLIGIRNLSGFPATMFELAAITLSISVLQAVIHAGLGGL